MGSSGCSVVVVGSGLWLWVLAVVMCSLGLAALLVLYLLGLSHYLSFCVFWMFELRLIYL